MAIEQTQLETIEVNGRTFVAGLVWKPLQSGRKYMAEAKAFGRDNNMEMVTIRKGRTGVLQAGYAPKGLARSSTLYSLAAALAGQLGDNWIGVFPIGRDTDRYVQVAVFKGSVVAGRGDKVDSAENIAASLRETYSLLAGDSDADFAQNGRIIAPESFEFGTESIALAELLHPKSLRNEYRLRPLTFGLTKQQAVIGCALIATAILGGTAYNWWSAKEAADNAKALALAELAAQQAEAERLQTEQPKPWESTPAAQAMFDTCSSHLSAAPLALGGWLFQRAECRPTGLVASYARIDGSPVREFVSAATALTGAAPEIHDGGTTARLNAVVALKPASSETLRPTAQVLLEMTSRVQSLADDSTFSVSEVPYEPDPEKPNEPAPDWTTSTFVLQTAYPPRRIFADTNLAGVRVSEVFTTLAPDSAELSWTVTGEIYGR